LNRLRDSLSNDYWRGRVTRAFVGSAAWNWRHANYALALSRALVALRLANARLLSSEFRHGLRSKVH
jgi:hypothetical protein